MHRDPRSVGDRDRESPLPLRATAIVLSLWVIALVFLAFVVVPLLFSFCAPPTGPL
jgi:hypothetical protein